LLLIGQLLPADTVLGNFYLPLISMAVHYANGDTRRMLSAPSRVFGRPGSSSRCGAATGPTSTRAARARARGAAFAARTCRGLVVCACSSLGRRRRRGLRAWTPLACVDASVCVSLATDARAAQERARGEPATSRGLPLL
jgi:hypothetical protein